MGYLVCEKCKNYYELQLGEKPEDFDGKCECGGELKYVETLGSSDTKNMEEMESTVTCPRCGTENPEGTKLCKSCKKILTGVAPSMPPKGDNKQNSIGGIFETWNEQSNAIKALSLIGICCVGILLIVGITGMFAPDKNTTNVPSTATPTSASTMTESQYASQAANWAGTVGDAITAAGNDMNSYSHGAMTTQDFITAIQTNKRTIDTVLGEEKATTPPAKYANVHQLIMSAEQDASHSLDDSINGAEQNNTAEVNQALDLMNSANTKFKQANTELDQMK